MARKFKLIAGQGDSGNQYVSVTDDGKLKLAQTLDYESFNNPSFTIRVQCKDERDKIIEKIFTINVVDIYEEPVPSPAPDPSAIYSAFGGPCGNAGLPMALRLYQIGSIGGNGLKTDSNYINKYETNMCSHQINVPNQSYTAGFPDMPSLTSFFAAVWDGQIYAPYDGTYRFATQSDDRAILYIYQGGLSISNRTLVIDDDYGNHGFAWSATGTITLKKGLHPFQLRFTQQPPTHLGIILYWNLSGSTLGGSANIPIPRTTYFGPSKGQMYRLDTNNEPFWL